MLPKIIMIVDDDEDDKYFFQAALATIDDGIRCMEARDGAEALEMLKGNPLPDLIFLDLNMPRLNGKQCLRLLKNTERLKKIPVVIYSTTKRPADEAETKSLGAFYFLTKPTCLSEIAEKISFIFDYASQHVSR
jgi:CheY-like chemotaxis protein